MSLAIGANMPYLGSRTGEPFTPRPPPANLEYDVCILLMYSDDCMVWYHPLTKEVFDSYRFKYKNTLR